MPADITPASPAALADGTVDLGAAFGRFAAAAPDRLHLAAHSHHYWPDVVWDAQNQVLTDAARCADTKWGPILDAVMPAVQRGIAGFLGLPDPASLVFAPNTHEFLKRIVSCLPADRPIRILSTDSEFHTFSRQTARWAEDGLVDLTLVPTEPFDGFADRFGAAASARHPGTGAPFDLVWVSQVFFNSGFAVEDLDGLVAAVPDPETFIVIDGYHGFLARPTDLARIADRAFYLSGGYKYAMAGEGVCFLHVPPGYGPRPRDTGWYAAFGALSAARSGGVPYAGDGWRFMGATFDPSGLYRQRAVLGWLADQGLTVAAIHRHATRLQAAFATGVDRYAIPGLRRADLVVGLDRPARGNFLTYRSPMAAALHERLMAHRIVTDVRGDRLRFGFGLYHRMADMPAMVERVAAAARG